MAAVVMTQDPSTHVILKTPPGQGGVVQGITGVVTQINGVTGTVAVLSVTGTVKEC